MSPHIGGFGISWRVRRLSAELQLAWIAASWIRDLSMHAIHPSFVTPLLVDSSARVLPEIAARQRLVGGVELAIIHAMLDAYLLAGKRLAIGWHVTLIWDALLAPGSSAAKLLFLPWKLAFPPPTAERFTARYQIDRMRRLAKSFRTTR